MRRYCCVRWIEERYDWDTLCDENKPVVLENIVFPTPVISVAIEPKTKADQDKMSNALASLRRKIPRSAFTPIPIPRKH